MNVLSVTDCNNNAVNQAWSKQPDVGEPPIVGYNGSETPTYDDLDRKWQPDPHVHLRRFPNGTLFLLKQPRKQGIHVCILCGNLKTDESWKAQRMSDFKYIRLEQLKGALFIVIL